MKLKKLAALACAATMIVSSLAGCGGSGDNAGGGTQTQAPAGSENSADASEGTQAPAENSGEVENIVFAFPMSKTVDMKPIEDALNEIIEPKINVHVTLEGSSMATYNNQLSMMQAGGEQVDCFGFLGTYSSMLAANQFLSMNDYIDTYGAGIKEVLGEDFLKATTNKGEIYAIPNYNGKAACMNIVLRKDLVDELNLPVDQLKQAKTFDEYCANLDLITEMFAKIHETHPEYACVVPMALNPNSLGFTTVPFVDNLNDNYGVLMPGEDSKITNVYESEEFKRLIQYAYDWNQAGYVLEDATTTQEASNTLIQNGRAAGVFIKGEEGQAEQITTATGVEMIAVKIVDPFITTADVNGICFALSATTEHPEAAMKFLNEMYTNADVVNLLHWGIEGVHYEKQDDGTVDFPEGVDANTTTYGLNMDWFFGNQFLGYIWGKGRDTTIYERLDANNQNSLKTPVMGFSYDSTVVSNEIAALSNVNSQYLPGLVCGTVDPETGIKEYNDALYAAGLQTVMDEKQAQLDAWKAENQ